MKKILATLIITSSLVFANDNSIGLDTIVGATLGIALGNQIGKGNGRDVAKIAGGLLGASIANGSRTPSYGGYDDSYNNNYYDNSRVVRPNNNYYYNNNYYDRGDNRYNNGYDRRQAPQVTVIYQDNDRYAPRREHHYEDHHHRDEYRDGYNRETYIYGR